MAYKVVFNKEQKVNTLDIPKKMVHLDNSLGIKGRSRLMIDENIIPLVEYLNNNGIETTASCGHEGVISLKKNVDIKKLNNLLNKVGISKEYYIIDSVKNKYVGLVITPKGSTGFKDFVLKPDAEFDREYLPNVRAVGERLAEINKKLESNSVVIKSTMPKVKVKPKREQNRKAQTKLGWFR